MHHKWMVLLTTLVLFSLLIAPVSTAQAQNVSPDCPPYEPGLLRDKELLHSLPIECIKNYKEISRQASSSASAQDAQPMTVGGPDGFGYTYNDSVAYNWISATTNSGLTGDDAFTGPINIGFNFPFYGVPQSQLYFSTNGLITFGNGSSEWYPRNIPIDVGPNNFIAPFWNDMQVGNPYNSGAIYYSQGGSAPNRYFVVEWRNVESNDGAGAFSFEAILYENGNVLVLHQSVPSDYYSTVGIEGVNGVQGLQYQNGFFGVWAGQAIQFSYPTLPTARILAYSLQSGSFVSPGGSKEFEIVIINPGTLGTDCYDLTTMSPAWTAAYYGSNGITPLTDTDGDTITDTGPVSAGSSITIIARYDVPMGSAVGDSNFAQIQLTSSLNNSIKTSVKLSMSVPAAFASVFQDEADGAMSFFTASTDETNTYKVTADDYLGFEPAVARLTNGNYVYAWDKYYPAPSKPWRNIEYALLSSNGMIVLPTTKLTDNSSATLRTDDGTPSIAIAPDGTVGIVWSRYVYNAITKQSNYNIFFATLNAAGIQLTTPTNISNNTVWGTSSDYNIPWLMEPTIAATSDNRFVISWSDSRTVAAYTYEDNVWYAVRNTAGANVLAPTTLTTDKTSENPILNSLTDGKVMVIWGNYEIYDAVLHYAVINSSGTISTPDTAVEFGYWNFATVWPHSYDAVLLPNGKVALAWVNGLGVEFSILNSSYDLESGPHIGNDDEPGKGISVTTDSSSHVIMTWVAGQHSEQFYALGDSTGAFLTEPMLYSTNGEYINVNSHGQGNAPYDPPSIARIRGNTEVGGVTLRYTDGVLQSVTSDSSGNYSINVPVGWSGTVTPSRAGYAFTPANRIYSNIQTDQTDQDYATRAQSNGMDTTGVFRPSNGLLYLKNSNDTGFADYALNYGLPGDYPVVGDWDGNGTVTIGIYRNGHFYLRNENTIGFATIVFPFGQPGDQPIAGDWDGDGTDTIGVYRPSNGQFQLRNSNDEGPAQMSFYLGNVGDVGVAGDWNGDGFDTTGVFRPSNGVIFLKDTNDTGFADYALNYGLPGDKPVMGDWDNDGIDTIGIYRNGTFYLRNENTNGFATIVFGLGNPGDHPIAGNWDGLP